MVAHVHDIRITPDLKEKPQHCKKLIFDLIDKKEPVHVPGPGVQYPNIFAFGRFEEFEFR